MATLTKVEEDWFNKLQKVLNECTFDTSDFDSYTIGDKEVTVFKDSRKVNEHHMTHCSDLYRSVEALDAEVFELKFPFSIASLAG